MTNVGRLNARSALIKVVLTTMALLLLIATTPASAQVKKNLRQANKNWQGGDVKAAVELYEKVLDATQPGATDRGDAVYALIMASFMSESGHDARRTQTLIAEYFSHYPRHPNRLEMQVVRDLLDSGNAAREEARGREQELLRQERSLEQQLAKARETSGENASLEAEKEETAEKRLAAKSSELEAAKQELAKQADALQKMRQRLVGDSGG